MAGEVFCEGGCHCGKVRYRMLKKPLIVHACHCHQCQCITGSAFVLNALVEADAVELVSGTVSHFHFPGTCHTAYFCPDCATYVWSTYTGGRLSACRFVRVGTLDDPDLAPPDVHIFTSSKQAWVPIPEGVPQFPEFYRHKDVWSAESLARMEPYWKKAGAEGTA